MIDTSSTWLRFIANSARERISSMGSSALRSAIERLELENAELKTKCEVVQSLLDRSKRDFDVAHRHRQEFFGLIERIEKQRDEWREMFKRSAMEQMTALNIVDRALARERRRNAFLVKKLNEYLEKDGKEPIDEKRLSEQDAPPSGEYKRYAESMMRLFRDGIPEVSGRDPSSPRPVDIDGVSERDEIAK